MQIGLRFVAPYWFLSGSRSRLRLPVKIGKLGGRAVKISEARPPNWASETAKLRRRVGGLARRHKFHAAKNLRRAWGRDRHSATCQGAIFRGFSDKYVRLPLTFLRGLSIHFGSNMGKVFRAYHFRWNLSAAP